MQLKKFPDTITIILVISLFFIALTWIIPAGEFDKAVVDGREVIVADSYKQVDPAPQGLAAFLTAPIKGFNAASFVIAFVFLVGGAFSVLTYTGAINAGLYRIITFGKKYPRYKIIILGGITALFSLAGATFGMSEEVLVFILITIPLAKAMGYDALLGTAIPVLGTGVGFAGAITNPFTIGIAQSIAQIPIFSGIEYRLIVWVILTLIACLAVVRYARRLDKNVKNSLLHDLEIKEETYEAGDFPELNTKRKLILLTFFLALALLIVGVVYFEWYINEIAGLFIGLAILSAVIFKIPINKAISVFIDGAKEMMTAALVIGLAKGLLVIAQDGKIIDTILNEVALVAGNMPKFISAELMFIFQCCLNFFIPSGSGQAALTMPIIAPLSDLIGVSRQVAVLAFQMGDGLTNMIVPTSGVTMGALSIAKIPYNKWLKWIAPVFVILFIVAMLLMLPPLLWFSW
ncbi:putative basic amino acid antiporter YfcC [Galbibacter sp. BG1]|uniref:YfcC family protein n=1 Tax=Galbibacter sp. BG1 TaxID=1170699 RepID=UPI0015B7C314|nr:Na+/H+ antiporter NhaC family protein [Galbibacter sp. BG1]QLE01891.1 putative basic amino acid antiporter YfcC [Galbibacter sp. BG1]